MIDDTPPYHETARVSTGEGTGLNDYGAGYRGFSADSPLVMAGLDPAIHVFGATEKSWMPGPSPGMTQSSRA